MKYFLTCPPGFEDVAAEEVLEKLKVCAVQRPYSFKGHLLLEDDQLDVLSLRSIYNAYIFLAEFKFSNLEDLGKKLAKVDLGEFARGKFRVTSRRIGEHPFTSLDVQAKAGKVIQQKYGLKVDLKNFDVEFEVDVIGNKFWIGVKLNMENLGFRPYKIFHHPAELGAPIAYCMIRKIPIKRNFLDAMTGSGTLAIERWFYTREKHKKENILAIDHSANFIQRATKNAQAAGAQISFKKYDATKLDKLGTFDAIVANPPYGRRFRQAKLNTLYEGLFKAVQSGLEKDGIFCLITMKISLVKKLISKYNFKILDFRRVEHGGLIPAVFYLQKPFKSQN